MNLSIVENENKTSKSAATLAGAPWLIAHKSMLGINKPYKLTLNHHDYVLWKNNSGKVFALNNICPHMQAPLSDGWICQQRNSIVCPFHALEFNSEGKLLREEKVESHTITKPLELIVKGDLIWTYGAQQPKLPIPNLISRITEGYDFLGATKEKSIQAEFLKCLKINYDFNHAIATHREPFKFNKIHISNYEAKGFYTTLEQTVERTNSSWKDIFQNPALLTAPKVLKNHFEYAFPCISSIITPTDFGELVQLFILYPQNQNTTKTFVLLYIKPNNKLNKLLYLMLRKKFLKAFDLVVQQDAKALETLYPEQKTKIRLPREEIMFHVEKLYREWK